MLDLQRQLIPIGGALLCAAVGSFHDLRTRRIPNFVTGPALLGGLLLHGVTGHLSGLGHAALAGLIAGSLGLAFWFAGGMGAGDVKLLAAVGCIAGLSSLNLLLVSIAIAGAIWGLALSVYRHRLKQTLRNVLALVVHHARHGIRPHPYLNLDNPRTSRLPFALPVTAGCLITLCSVLCGVCA